MSPVIRLRHIHRFKDRHGRVRFYLRIPGRKAIALPGAPGSPEFIDAYNTEVLGQREGAQVRGRVQPGSMEAVIVSFYTSHTFIGLRASTQAVYRRLIEEIRTKHGSKPIRLIDATGVRKLVSEKKGPTAANRRLSILRHLIQHARDEMGLVRNDPTREVARVRYKGAGIRPWDDAHVEAYRKRHPTGTVARLALELLLNVGQRRGDTMRMGRQHIVGGAIRIRQSKTQEWVEVPILPELAAELAHVPAGQMTFLEVQGRVRSTNGFYSTFRDWCEEAGLEPGLSSHGLRKACGRRLAEAGCSAHQIMAVLGHRTLSEAQRYTEAADRKRLAAEGMARVAQMPNKARKPGLQT